MNFINLLHNILSGPLFIVILFSIGIFYTIYLKFPQIRFFKKAFSLLFKGNNNTDNTKGETSAFQALATSLGGSIGVGCVAGTGMAINIGGPSSIFWILISAFFGMAIKYVEVLLCHKYRTKAKDNSIIGTQMNFMVSKLNLKFLAIITSGGLILSSIVSGNMPQSNSLSKILNYTFGIDLYLSGLVLTILISFIILGGIKRIGLVAERLIPLMSLIFYIICLVTIFANYKNIIPSIKLIFSNPFKPSSAIGGFLGTSIFLSIQKGINVSYYTNDAGSGVSGIAHATSKRESSFHEAVYSMIEPFLSTIIMCSLTALVILTSNTWKEKYTHKFDFSDIVICSQKLDVKNKNDLSKIKKILTNKDSNYLYNGILNIEKGKIENKENITVINNKSVAEELLVYIKNKLYTGNIEIINGKVNNIKANIFFVGKSLVTGVLSTSLALNHGPLKKVGSYLLNLCLILFAITTVIAWYYYGDRGLAFLGAGNKILLIFKIIFIILFFLGSVIDASIIWKLSEIIYVLVGIPTLLSLLFMYKEVKNLTDRE